MLHCLHKHKNWFNIDFETKLYNCFAKIMFADGGGRVWVRGYCLPAISSPSTPSSCQLAPWPPPSHPEPPTPPPPTSSSPRTPQTCQVAHHHYIQRVTFKAKSVSLPSPSAAQVSFPECLKYTATSPIPTWRTEIEWLPKDISPYSFLCSLATIPGRLNFDIQRWISSKHSAVPEPRNRSKSNSLHNHVASLWSQLPMSLSSSPPPPEPSSDSI